MAESCRQQPALTITEGGFNQQRQRRCRDGACEPAFSVGSAPTAETIAIAASMASMNLMMYLVPSNQRVAAAKIARRVPAEFPIRNCSRSADTVLSAQAHNRHCRQRTVRLGDPVAGNAYAGSYDW
jgi:hypothetical protein